jgi:hypothetical protein
MFLRELSIIKIKWMCNILSYFMLQTRFYALLFILLSGSIYIQGQNIYPSGSELFRTIPLAYVPASFPVNFSLFTFDTMQYAVFYDSTHEMTLACRRLADSVWDYQKLDSKVGWDSHNYLSMLVDDEGYIHLAGNLHSSKLLYFRSSIPLNIHSTQAIHTMTGNEEDVTTYPEFMRGPNRELFFHYRYGRSGSGYKWKFHPSTQCWAHAS